MSSFPTTSDLADLGLRIAEDGLAAHEETVAEIAALGREIEPDRPSLHVLADMSAPDPVRVRALVCVGYRWSDIRRQLVERQEQFERSLVELLELWTDHRSLRRDGSAVDVADLADSRSRLDALRWVVARQRADLRPGDQMAVTG
jgi:hypothetical protein